MKRLVLILCAFLLFCSKENKADNDENTNIQINETLPSLNLTLSNDKLITDEELTGKVSVIILFTVACPDCQKQLPIVEQLYSDIKDDDSVVFFGISRAQAQNVIEEYWQGNDLTLPYSAQEDAAVYNLFAKAIVPRIYIADKNRIVKFISTDNPLVSYDDLKNMIELLK